MFGRHAAALSRQIAGLEAQLGTPLFERHPRLAPAGPPRRRPTRILRGYAELPVRLEPAVTAVG